MRWRLQSLLPASMNRAMRRHLFRARESKRKGLTRKARFLRLNATLLLLVFAGAFRSSHQKSRSRSLYYSSPRRKDRPAQDSINGDAGNRVHVRRSEYSTHTRISKKGRASLHCLLIQISNSIGRIAILPRTTHHSTRQTYVGSK